MTLDNDVIHGHKPTPSEETKRRQQRQKRRNARREANNMRRRMLSFIWATKEVAPIIEQYTHTQTSHPKIVEDFKSQSERLASIQDSIYSEATSSDKYQLMASISASQLTRLNIDGETENSIIKLLSERNNHDPDIAERIDAGILSADVLVNIKIALLPCLTEINDIASDLSLPAKQHADVQAWANDMILSLAKDIAFNWDKKTSYRDRETLFVMMIPTCGRIVLQSFVDYITKEYGSNKAYSEEFTLDINFPKTYDAIKELDMGYMDSESRDLPWLYQEINKYLIKQISNLSPTRIDRRHISSLVSSISADVDAIASETWQAASQRVISQMQDELETLSDEEAEALLEEKYSDPMPLDKFFAPLMNKLHNWNGLIDPMTFNLESATRVSQERLSNMWGLSNAICKVRESEIEK